MRECVAARAVNTGLQAARALDDERRPENRAMRGSWLKGKASRGQLFFCSSSLSAGGYASFGPTQGNGLITHGNECGWSRVCPACSAELADCQGAHPRKC